MLPSGDVNTETIFSFLLFCVVIICFIISLDGLWCLAEDPTPDCVQVCKREYDNDCLAVFAGPCIKYSNRWKVVANPRRTSDATGDGLLLIPEEVIVLRDVCQEYWIPFDNHFYTVNHCYCCGDLRLMKYFSSKQKD